MRRVREQRHLCGSRYMEVDYFSISEAEHRATARAKRERASRLVQKNLNARNACRHMVQLVNTNFGPDDLHLSLTYDREHLTGGEEADRILMRYLRRLAYRCRKKGMPAPAYIAVTEYRDEGDEGKTVRPHHHVILRCALSREEIEDLWSDRQGRRLGLARADRLQPDHESLEALARYITKYPNRRHRWHQSRGLRQPVRPRPNDSRVKSQSRLDRMARERVDDREFWEKMWPGWRFECCVPVWNETTAQWSLYCKFWREGTV